MNNFPTKVGEYDVPIGNYTAHISVYNGLVRLSRMDLVAGLRGDCRPTKLFDVILYDENGNKIDYKKQMEENHYFDYLNNFFSKISKC